jgi:hypothetical protein
MFADNMLENKNRILCRRLWQDSQGKVWKTQLPGRPNKSAKKSGMDRKV